MSNRWTGFVLFGLGVAAGPIAFHFGGSLHKPAEAEDKIFAQQTVKVQEGEVQSTSAPYCLDLIGLDLTGIDRRKLVPSEQRKIHATGDGSVGYIILSGDGKDTVTISQLNFCETVKGIGVDKTKEVNFAETIKIFDGAFNVFTSTVPAMMLTTMTSGDGNSIMGLVPQFVQIASDDGNPINCCEQRPASASLCDYPKVNVPGVGPVPIAIGWDRPVIVREVDAMTNLIGGSEVITSGGAISFDGGTRYRILLTAANTTQNAEAMPETEEECAPNLTSKFIELSQELAKRKLQRLSPCELAQKIEELEQEISNDEAITKLEEARKHLQDLANKHPNSPAAQSAMRMLEAENTLNSERTLNPTPDFRPTF